MSHPIAILIIDDNPADIEILQRHFETLAGEITTQVFIAHHAHEADLILHEKSNSIVFVDNQLGKSRGVELIEGWRRQYPGCAFVLLTGHGGENIAAQAIRAGAVDYLNKNHISAEELLRCLFNVITQSREHGRLHSILNVSGAGILAINAEGMIIMANPSAHTIFGYKQDSLINEPITRLMPPMFIELHQRGMQRYLQSGKSSVLGRTVELQGQRADGEVFPLEISLAEARAFDEITFLAIMRDISERKALETLRDQQAAVIQSTMDMVAFTEPNGIIKYLNPAGKSLLEFTQDIEALKISIKDLLTDESRSHYAESVVPALQKTGHWRGELVIEARREGGEIPVSVVVNAQKTPYGPITAFAFIMRDISEMKRTEQRLKNLAEKDTLTGLANRAMFMEHLQRAIMRYLRNSGLLAVMYLDLDQFKFVNDSYGHNAGDELLKMVAARLQGIVRRSDVVARLGGDEFVVLMESANAEDINHVSSVAEKIITQLRKPCEVVGQEVFIGASVGIATFPTCGDNAETLMVNADTAMYQAKKLGRNNYQFYTDALQEKMRRQSLLKQNLHHALESRQLNIAYQPIVNAQGVIVGVESLLRLKCKQGLDICSPEEIVRCAEQYGLMPQLGDLIMENALREFAQARRAYGFTGYLSINTSVIQLRQADFCVRLCDLLKKFAMPHHAVLLEITETMIIQPEQDVRCCQTLDELKAQNITTAIDDFGTGYASFRHLHQLNVNTIKIDQSFIQDICTNEVSAGTVKAILSMAAATDLHVIIEGVESREQVAWFDEYENVIFQGFYFGKPSESLEFLSDVQERGRNVGG